MVFILALLSACGHSETKIKNETAPDVLIMKSPQIKRICMCKTPGYGQGRNDTDAFSTIFFDENGDVYYQHLYEIFTSKDNDLKEIFRGYISQTKFKELSNLLIQDNFFNEKDMGIPVDLSKIWFEASTDSITKSFIVWTDELENNPEKQRLKAIEAAIDKLKTEIKWEQITDTNEVKFKRIDWCGIKISRKDRKRDDLSNTESRSATPPPR